MIDSNHRDYLYNYLKKKFPKARKEDLEDSVQNALVKAYRFLHQWDRKCSFKSWLAHIAFNMYVDIFRKTYVKHEQLVESEDGLFVFEKLTEDDFSETFCNHDYLIELSRQILSGFEDNIHIQAFKLNVIDEIDYKDIATIQNVPIGTVKSRVFRGRKLLRDRYQEICNQETSLLV